MTSIVPSFGNHHPVGAALDGFFITRAPEAGSRDGVRPRFPSTLVLSSRDVA